MKHVFFIVLVAAGMVRAGTYYIDYETGADSNAGTTKAAPWKHCPGMAPFTGSYSHTEGDRFVFKGGVTWPNAALPLLINDGGADGNPDEYGALDTTWYTGSSWSRAVFDGDSTDFTNWTTGSAGTGTQAQGNCIWLDGRSAAWNLIESIEFKDFMWNDNAARNDNDCWAVTAFGADNVTVRNCYSHDWIVAADSDGKYGGFSTGNSASGFRVENCIVEGPDTIDAQYVTAANSKGWLLTSGCGTRGATTINCEIRRTTQGIWGGAHVYGNLVEDCCNSFASDAHENGAWFFSGAVVHDNIWRRLGEGVTMYLVPAWGGATGDIWFYNNIVYDIGMSGHINSINVTNGSAVLPSQNDYYIFNNLLKAGRGFSLGTGKTGEPMASLFLQNNIVINTSGEIYWVVDSEADDFPVNTIDHNVHFTLAEA